MAEPVERPTVLPTPDGRYIVVRGRLWRASDPDLNPDTRVRHVAALMDARRMFKAAKASGNAQALSDARRAVDAAKTLLRERGPVWWTDGAPDLGRKMVRNTPYADWYDGLDRNKP